MWLLAAIGELTEGILRRHCTWTTSSTRMAAAQLIHSSVGTRCARVTTSARGPAPVGDVTFYDWLDVGTMT